MKSDIEISNWFDNLLLDKKLYNKEIVDKKNGKLIGYAGIAGISNMNLSGEYFIFIGDKLYHGKFIGTFITREIVKIGFNYLDLNRIMLTFT